jgi:hypothetical protein
MELLLMFAKRREGRCPLFLFSVSVSFSSFNHFLFHASASPFASSSSLWWLRLFQHVLNQLVIPMTWSSRIHSIAIIHSLFFSAHKMTGEIDEVF